MSVIYNGVAGPPRQFPADRRAGRGSPPIGCIGRIAPEKGQREFLAAAADHPSRAVRTAASSSTEPRCSPTRPPTRYDAEVRAAAAGLPVEFPGWVDGRLRARWRSLDLLLVPSAGHEATTRVILEAFAAGVPVIAFRSGGIPEVVEDGVDGLLAGSAKKWRASRSGC